MMQAEMKAMERIKQRTLKEVETALAQEFFQQEIQAKNEIKLQLQAEKEARQEIERKKKVEEAELKKLKSE